MHGLPYTKSWYERRANKVMKNDVVKVPWDFYVQIDRVITARQPDTILVKKEEKVYHLVVGVPSDMRTQIREDERIKNIRA